MKLKNILLVLSLFLLLFASISSITAAEDDNITDDSLTLEINEGSDLNLNQEKLTVNMNDSALSQQQTIQVDDIGETHNEMSEHTIRDAINSANDGDIIVINGQSYDHVHIMIDKQLTIKSNVSTLLNPCSSTAYSGYSGIFYLTSKASGTVIEGFNFHNDNGNIYSSDDYGILISGASDVIIRNCTFSNDGYGDSIRIEESANAIISNVTISDANNGIRIKNSQGITVKNSFIQNSNYGVYDVDSTKTVITSNNISNNKVTAIGIAGSSNNSTISYNNLTSSVNGIILTSSDNIDIFSNYIASNSQYGVYINCAVEKINITGNFFYKNSFADGGGEIYNGPNTSGLFKQGGELLEYINNNYFVGNNVRPVNTASGGVFLRYAFEINENVACPIIHFIYEQKQWSEGDYRLKLSEVTQSKKGVYTISIVDSSGNVATGLSSVPVTFYLNKNNNYVSPQEGDVYRTVMMVDGTATVRFYASEFNESGNVITVVTPGYGQYLTSDSGKNVKTFTVDDDQIPGTPTATKITLSNLVTTPNSNVDYTITLTDINNNPISGEQITFNINSKNLYATTNSKGQATIKINQNTGTYNIKVTYTGDDIDYLSSSAQAKITVNKLSTKIVASNYAMFIKKATYYKLTLKDSSNNVLANQKVTIKVNKKTYNVKTNAKGVAKVKLKLKKGKYKVKMTYKENSKYKAAKKTTKITVKKKLKSKLTAPKLTTTPKTKTNYAVTLKDENGNVIKKQKVKIKVNGKTYTKKTNSKGQAIIKVKFSKLKSYKVKASFKATKKYKKSSKNGKITVGKIATKLTAPSISTNPNTQKDYTVTLKTSAGKAIAKQSLKITLNGRTYTKTTNSNGQATIQISFSGEGTYKASVSYSGSTLYKASTAQGSVKVSRTQTQLNTYNRTFSNDTSEEYTISLKDSSGNALSGQVISYTLNNQSYSQTTDSNGQINVNMSGLSVGTYAIDASFAQTNLYGASASSSTINILNSTGITYIDGGLPSDEIQSILDETTNSVEFLATTYDDISLNINRLLNITFRENTTLNGKADSPVLTISVSNFSISDLTINAGEGSGIVVNADNVSIINNTIINTLDSSKSDKYESGELVIPGNGINVSGANNILISDNNIQSFGNAILVENSDNVKIDNNTLSLSNYGINYGEGVKNTNITYNLITKNIGLYVMDVPEGPLGYGIFLNQSAVNVTIMDNNISDNYMGISIDANFSTGIVIQRNLICDNALEGIRFNAGYDLAENAVEPDVNDNAIYRNAKGPSMMILGELSANPEGIYHYGLYNVSKRLQLGANWYGKSARVTWDYDTNTTGYGTMCPRINTTYISVNEIEVVSAGNYSITFYKYSEVASNLPKFEMYATLNDNVEIKFYVVDGVGTFSFDSGYINGTNIIKVSIGSLTDQYRTFEVLLNKTLDSSEIPSE